MAEFFQEVCKHLKRMCEQYGNNCIKCPLENKNFCSLSAGDRTMETYKEVEKIIMSWAAEHPEPIYPTWEEWLITQGIIKENPNGVGRPMLKLFERIPADIAQKLGITPKEK